jgi:hypothetical protein
MTRPLSLSLLQTAEASKNSVSNRHAILKTSEICAGGLKKDNQMNQHIE